MIYVAAVLVVRTVPVGGIVVGTACTVVEDSQAVMDTVVAQGSQMAAVMDSTVVLRWVVVDSCVVPLFSLTMRENLYDTSDSSLPRRTREKSLPGD